jgi:SAM-dependent methyltransferase
LAFLLYHFERRVLSLSQNSISKAELEELWSAASQIWNEHEAEAAFEGYVSADFAAIYERLVKLRTRAQTFLEWGSGLGVVATMASRLGFDAYGIEIKPELVHAARDLAARFRAQPKFAVGSFIPDAFDERIHSGDEFFRTECNEPDAYSVLRMDLGDFDLIYAYPWPEEHTVFRSIVRRCAAPHTLYLQFDVREGLSLSRPAAGKSRRTMDR